MRKIKLARGLHCGAIWQKESLGRDMTLPLFRDTDGRVAAFTPLIFYFQREYSKLLKTLSPKPKLFPKPARPGML